jgi:hypothetical protein
MALYLTRQGKTRINDDLSMYNYRYSYPLGNSLKPGSELHDKLRDEIMARAMSSHDVVSNRFDSWNKLDETLTSYVPMDEEEEELLEEDSRKPVSIVVPVSYAALETIVTYQVAAFLDSPIFKYEGMDDRDVLGSILLERTIDLQVRRAKMAIQLHTMFRDSMIYGIGAVSPIWGTHHEFRTRRGDGITRPTREPIVGFSGNELYNIDPYTFLPDPNVAAHDVQRGEYVGWLAKEHRLALLGRENQGGEGLFNCKYLEHVSQRESILRVKEDKRDKDSVGFSKDPTVTNEIDVIHLYVELVPAEWEIGKKDVPEKWMFSIAADQVIIRAEPMDLDHNYFPICVSSPDSDGYSALPISRLETVYGLQKFANFLLNSHIANVRKALYNQMVVDPKLINMGDLKNPGFFKHVRLRQEAWGRGVQGAVEQLKIYDVTANHIPEAFSIFQMSERGTGATDALQGLIRRGGERRSATEFRETKSGALSRMDRIARMANAMALQDLAYMLAVQTQQFQSEEQRVKISGRMEEVLRRTFGEGAERVTVSPRDLEVAFDVLPFDGTSSAMGDPNVFLQGLQLLGKYPMMMNQFDMVRIFEHFMQANGFKNIGDFRAKVKVVPDEEAAREAERGNLVPTGELGGQLP